jgi:RNA polymerase sigma-70 factor, ECF subfamily
MQTTQFLAGKLVTNDNNMELGEIVSRIMAGDPEAEEELISRYSHGVSVIIDQIVRSASAAEDVSQETFRIALEKIRRGDVRQHERLSGFICGVARNAAIDYVRRARRTTNLEDVGNAEDIPDPAPNQLDEMMSREKALIVRRVIGELNRNRDSDLLFRYFIAEEDKDSICADLDLSRIQFNSVIFRARARFKELYARYFAQMQ